MVTRKHYLVEKSAQLKFVGVVAIAFLILLAFMLWNVRALLTAIAPQGILEQSRGHILTFIIGTVIIMIITAVVIIKYTHSFFGPIPRLKRELKEMAETEQYHQLHIRDGDYLKELSEHMNLVIDKLIKE